MQKFYSVVMESFLREHVHRVAVWWFIFSLSGMALAGATVPRATNLAGMPGANAEKPRGLFLTATEDCGRIGAQPHLVTGSNWQLTAAEKKDRVIPDARFLNLNYHSEAVVYHFGGLRAGAVYVLRVAYFNITHARQQRLLINGVQAHGPLDLPLGQLVIREYKLRQPPGQQSFELRFERISGPSAIVSAIELWSDHFLRGQAKIPEMPQGWARVTTDDCGRPEAQPRYRSGKFWTLSAKERRGLDLVDPRLSTLCYDRKRIVFQYDGLKKKCPLPDSGFLFKCGASNATDVAGWSKSRIATGNAGQGTHCNGYASSAELRKGRCNQAGNRQCRENDGCGFRFGTLVGFAFYAAGTKI